MKNSTWPDREAQRELGRRDLERPRPRPLLGQPHPGGAEQQRARRHALGAHSACTIRVLPVTVGGIAEPRTSSTPARSAWMRRSRSRIDAELGSGSGESEV